jgi:hypothetical protein
VQGTVGRSTDTTNNGIISVEPSGTFSAGAKLALQPASILRFGLKGTVAGIGYGRVQSTGAAALGGSIDLVERSGYVPSLDSTYAPLTYGSRVGTVSRVYDWLPAIMFTPAYGATSMVLTARVADTTPPVTLLATTPAGSDGQNGWYKTWPTVTLTRDETGTTFWQLDSTVGTWTTYLLPFQVLDGTHTLYYHSVDSYENTETIRSTELKVDTLAPVIDSLASPTHSVGTTSVVATVAVAWTATDSNSGIVGYSWQWSNEPTTVPDASLEGTSGTAGVTGPALAPGTWYFHLRAQDAAGNWSATAPLGPFGIVEPVVSISIDTTSWDFGVLGAGETSTSAQITVSNTGNVSEQLLISATDALCSGETTWALSNTAAKDQFTLELFALSNAAYLTTSLTEFPGGLSMAPGGTIPFTLTFGMPTEHTGRGLYRTDLTVMALQTPEGG